MKYRKERRKERREGRKKEKEKGNDNISFMKGGRIYFVLFIAISPMPRALPGPLLMVKEICQMNKYIFPSNYFS